MAIVSIVFDPLDGSEALVADVAQDSLITAISAVAASGDASAISTAKSVADSALSVATVADSVASAASSAAVVGIDDASEAASAASTAKSVADSGLSIATIADSIADAAKVLADSAIGTEPAVGEYYVTDIKRDATGSIVIEYNDVPRA